MTSALSVPVARSSGKSSTTSKPGRCFGGIGPTWTFTRTCAMWDDQLSMGLTSSAEDSRARISALRETVRGLTGIVADSGSSSVASCLSSAPPGFLSRTSLAFYPATEGPTLPLSFEGWQNSVMWGPGGFLTLSTSEWPSDGSGSSCSLAEILEPEVPEKYLLSPKACRGILRRAKRRGGELPQALAHALHTTAGTDQSR